MLLIPDLRPQLSPEKITKARIQAIQSEMNGNVSTLRHSQLQWMLTLANARHWTLTESAL